MTSQLIVLLFLVTVNIDCPGRLETAQYNTFFGLQEQRSNVGQGIPAFKDFLIPRSSKYSLQFNKLQLEVIVKKHTSQTIVASFVLRDSTQKIVDSWGARFKNEDTDETETDSERDYSDASEIHEAVDVSVYRSYSPFWTELRIPFEHPTWIRIHIQHPKLLDKEGGVQRLLLKHKG